MYGGPGISSDGDRSLEGGSQFIYAASRVRGLVFAALFSTFICFPVADEREESDAIGYHGGGNTFQCNQWDVAFSQFFSCALPGKYEPATYWSHPLPWLGILLFVVGMGINWQADHVIRNLRKPGDTRHYLPEKGFYRYVTSANYFGELVEWTGFALLTASPAAWVFVWWTAANLVPRADAIYKCYCEEFGRQAVGNRKRIIPYIY